MITITFKGNNAEVTKYVEDMMKSDRIEILEKEIMELKDILRNSSSS
jgi:hypothetical protein